MALLCEDLSELYSHFNEFRLNDEFCDVVIKAGERSFHCHRVILASAFNYFRTTFSANFSEGKKNEFELKGIDACDFELLLTYVYGKQIDIKEDNIYRLLRISHYLGPQSFESKVINCIIESNSIPLNTALSIFMFACEKEKVVLFDKLVPFVAENFMTLCKHVKFHFIDGKSLLQVMCHPKLDKDFTAILDFLGEWIRCVNPVNEKLLPDIMAAVNVPETLRNWIIESLLKSNRQTQDDTGNGDRGIESSNEKDMNEVEDLEQCFFGIDAAGEFEENIRGNRLPFQVFTLDSLSAEPSERTYAINTYKFINRDNKHDVYSIETKDWSIPQNFLKIHCKSVFVDALQFTIYCTSVDNQKPQTSNFSSAPPSIIGSSLRPRSVNMFVTPSSSNQLTSSIVQTPAQVQNPKYTFSPFIHYTSPKRLKTHECMKDVENVAVAVDGTDIYLYNDASFVIYNTERDEWISISSSTDYTRTLSPNLVSCKGSLYLIGGKYLPLGASNTQAFSSANYLSSSRANGKSFQRFDPREGKWEQLPMMKYARYKSASCIYNDELYVSGGDNLAFFKGYVERFDFEAGEWDVFNVTMPEPKMNHILLAHNDKLWFFGGQTYSQKSVSNICSWYAYDMKERNWTDIFHMPKSYGKFKAQRILDVVVNM